MKDLLLMPLCFLTHRIPPSTVKNRILRDHREPLVIERRGAGGAEAILLPQPIFNFPDFLFCTFSDTALHGLAALAIFQRKARRSSKAQNKKSGTLKIGRQRVGFKPPAFGS